MVFPSSSTCIFKQRALSLFRRHLSQVIKDLQAGLLMQLPHSDDQLRFLIVVNDLPEALLALSYIAPPAALMVNQAGPTRATTAYIPVPVDDLRIELVVIDRRFFKGAITARPILERNLFFLGEWAHPPAFLANDTRRRPHLALPVADGIYFREVPQAPRRSQPLNPGSIHLRLLTSRVLLNHCGVLPGRLLLIDNLLAMQEATIPEEGLLSLLPPDFPAKYSRLFPSLLIEFQSRSQTCLN